MKKIYTILWLLVVSMTLSAAEISQEEAQERARAFLSQQAGGKQAGRRAMSSVSLQSAETDLTGLYIFNIEGGGYVIASGDDRTQPVLGYSLTGQIDCDNLPANLRSWLQGYAEDIQALGKANITSVAAGTYLEPIAPLIQTHWGQGEPYSLLTPLYTWEKPVGGEGYPSLTGCVATAMAQLMYYHQWPKAPTEPVPGYTFTFYKDDPEPTTLDTLPAVTFRWDKMLTEYSKDKPGTEEQRMAVAELMRYCGQSVKMKYSPDMSGAHSMCIPIALRRFFGYSKSLALALREDYSIQEWHQMIWNELNQKRPVFFAGDSKKSGHAFIIDGYDGNGLFHVNWGWSGKSDGYYAVNVLNPKNTTSAGASASAAVGYVRNQEIVVGMEPSTGMEPEVPEKTVDVRLKDNPYFTSTFLTFSVNYLNYDGISGKFNFGWVVKNDDGSYKPVVATDKPNELESGFYVKKQFNIGAIRMDDGQYRIYPAYQDLNVPNDTWHRLGSEQQSFIMKIEDQKIKLQSSCSLKIINAYFETSNDAPLDQNAIMMVVENQGDEEVELITTVELACLFDGYYEPLSTSSQTGSCAPVKLQPKERTTLRFDNVVIPIQGQLWLGLADLDQAIYYDMTYIDITKEPHYYDLQVTDYQISLQADEPNMAKALTGYIVLKNNDSRDFNYSLIMKGKFDEKEGSQENSKDKYSEYKDIGFMQFYSDEIPSDSIVKIRFVQDEDGGLVNEKTDLHFDLTAEYGDLGDKCLFDITIKPGTTVTPKGVTAIDGIEILRNQAPTPYYNLLGRRLQGVPTRPGLYIREGRKEIMK